MPLIQNLHIHNNLRHTTHTLLTHYSHTTHTLLTIAFILSTSTVCCTVTFKIIGDTRAIITSEIVDIAGNITLHFYKHTTYSPMFYNVGVKLN